jgi:hypothetical protein
LGYLAKKGLPALFDFPSLESLVISRKTEIGYGYLANIIASIAE